MAEMEKYTNKVDYVLQLAKKEALARAGFFGAVSMLWWKETNVLFQVSIILKFMRILADLQINELRVNWTNIKLWEDWTLISLNFCETAPQDELVW